MRLSSYRNIDIVFLAFGFAVIGAMIYFALFISAALKVRPQVQEPSVNEPAATYRFNTLPPALDTDVNGRPMGEN
ncbi:MAG TPA: hypothetical protein VMC43_03690 [Candidatus Paceibacterota bacterium]|nr:hypothetical protein [Candidatus Paceibacterota bacterium]